jgi:hypothetical protein
MRHIPGALSLFLVSGLTVFAQETIVPTVLNSLQPQQVPYSYNGYLGVGASNGFFSGSGSLVEDGVFLTAAHVVFDDVNLKWEPVNSISYYPRQHTQSIGSYKPAAIVRWASYATRVENDGSGTGESSVDTFNIDYAVGYFSSLYQLESLARFPEVNVDAEEVVSILRENRDKMIVGYPSDTDFVPPANVGLMHATAPGDYFCFWSGLEDRTDTWRDSEDFWVATYEFEGVTTYSGNSGGPIYVKDDEGRWVIAGIVVGSSGSEGVLVRGIDENGWTLIEQATAARGTGKLRRVTDLTAAQTSSTTILLEWSDNSVGETETLIYRLDGSGWEVIDTVAADRTTYGDVNVIPGQVYRYRVQPVAANKTRAPKSAPATVVTSGRSSVAADYFAQPWLGFVTEGDSNWFVDDSNRLRAGRVRSLGFSSLRLDLIGPGTLDFNWSVSSEVNPDYNTPGTLFGEIYDAVFLYLDGVPVMNGDEDVFLSGFINPTDRQLVIPAGNHTIEWIYEKDPYSSEGEDTAFLNALTWTPDPAAPYPVLGGFAMDDPQWHGSTWFGHYLTTGTPWAQHAEFDWIYLRPGNGHDLYFHSVQTQLQDLYTSPSVFPWVYHIGRETWLYYYTDSGSFGERLWFYDTQEQVPFRVN